MKSQYYTACTLNGFIATEEDSLEWLFALGDIDHSSYSKFIEQVGALVMGSTTYEWLLKHSDKVLAETGSAWPYVQPTWVLSSRNLELVPDAKIRVVSGAIQDLFPSIVQSASDKNIWIVGGGEVAGQFCDAGLLDEIIVQLASATLSAGKPFLPRTIPGSRLNCTSVEKIGPKMVEIRYEIDNK